MLNKSELAGYAILFSALAIIFLPSILENDQSEAPARALYIPPTPKFDQDSIIKRTDIKSLDVQQSLRSFYESGTDDVAVNDKPDLQELVSILPQAYVVYLAEVDSLATAMEQVRTLNKRGYKAYMQRNSTRPDAIEILIGPALDFVVAEAWRSELNEEFAQAYTLKYKP